MSVELREANMKDGRKLLRLTSPYHAGLVKRCRALNGEWNAGSKAWYFPLDLRAQIGALCMEFFGVDPTATTAPELVNVEVELDGKHLGQDYWLLGRVVLSRIGRDDDVRPGEGVSIVAGGFAASGGSRNNPVIGYPDEGTRLLIRDVPRTALEQFAADLQSFAHTITEKEPEPSNAAKLLEEGAALVDKLRKLMDQLSEDEKRQLMARFGL